MTVEFFEGEWWRKAAACDYFSRELIKYSIQIYISYMDNGDVNRITGTGIIVDLKGKLLWVSAGHVVQAIHHYFQQGMVNEFRWIDRFDTPGGETYRFTGREIICFYKTPPAPDYGAILFPILETDAIRRNSNIKPLVLRNEPSRTGREPEGYVFAGFPYERVEISSNPGPPGKDKITLTANFSCLPIERRAWEEMSRQDENWSDKEAFYGQVLPFSDIAGNQPSELIGMSGGPIFSFFHEGGIVNIELEAIFDSYLSVSRQIKGESVNRVFTDLDSWLGNVK